MALGFPWWLSRWRIHLPLQEMQEVCVQSLNQEDPLEEEMTTHSSVLSWRIPWTEEPGSLQSMGSCKELNMTEVTETTHKTACSHLGFCSWASWQANQMPQHTTSVLDSFFFFMMDDSMFLKALAWKWSYLWPFLALLVAIMSQLSQENGHKTKFWISTRASNVP